MYSRLLVNIIVVSIGINGACSAKEYSALPDSSASYNEINTEVGCYSKYSEDKKGDIFRSQYMNHWMTWSGEVLLAKSDEVSLNIDGKGIQDLKVIFADKQSGYNLKKGDFITVRFIMKHSGGCILPFSGNFATIINKK